MTIADFSDLTDKQCRSARIARDRRFDGRFYVAVKTTGIFCRPICPATTPREENVQYFANQALALKAGYRPCLRCRPDSVPGSWAWQGSETTLRKAVRLIEQGALQDDDLATFAEKLGITDRYLRKLFITGLGVAPKQYAQYHQLMFAKQLLHSSTMSIADIGIASGFNSVRRFNDAFRKILKLTPGDIRKNRDAGTAVNKLTLAFRPPLNWEHMLNFYRLRTIHGIEDVGESHYQRTFTLNNAKGWFRAEPTDKNTLNVEFNIDDVRQLRNVVIQIRRMFDLDADITVIEHHLEPTTGQLGNSSGIRIPGVWSSWEAGLRAILGQQISVKAAITQLNRFVDQLGCREAGVLYFPDPATVVNSDLSFLKMPQTRRDTITRFAKYMIAHSDNHPSDWSIIKGIGPWTISYARLRGLSEPDCFLGTDLVVRKAMSANAAINKETTSPWGSYATFHCWNSQS